jgi:hypothetical protein
LRLSSLKREFLHIETICQIHGIILTLSSSYKSDEAAFKAAYPSYMSGHTDLLTAINKVRKDRGDRVTRK